MSTEQDQLLNRLFAQAPTVSESSEFTRRVIARIDQDARRRKIRWLVLDIAAALMIWLVSDPLQNLAMQITPWIMSSLLELGNEPWTQILAPVNNLASVIALTFLLGRSVYRRLIA